MSKDDELQERIEKGNELISNSEDERAYREVFKRLDKKPYVQFADSFEDRIISKVLKTKQRQVYRDLAWFAFGVVLLLVAFVFVLIETGTKFITTLTRQVEVSEGMLSYTGLLLFGLFFVVLLNRLDKKFVLRRRH